MKVDIEKEKSYGALALKHAKLFTESIRTIKPNTPEWDAWRAYFLQHMQFEPFAMQRVRTGLQSEMTVPADRPEQFDGSYTGPPRSRHAA